VAYPPTLAITVPVPRLTGRTAHVARRECTGVRVRARIRGNPCSPSHFTVPCGGAPLSIIKQDINTPARPLRTPDSPGHTREGPTLG
jgi:putative transposase